MAETMHSNILGRMAGRVTGDVADQPLASSRAVRLALTKAANDTVGLVLTVTGMSDETQSLDGLLQAAGDDLMLVGLHRDGRLAGILTLDVQLRAAVLEMQTVGSLLGLPAEARRATGTDKTMCDPLLDALMQALPPAMAGSEFDGWIDGCQTGERIADARAAGLVLPDCDYRMVRLTVDLGVADRDGVLMIALPPVAPPEIVEPEVMDTVDWGARFRLSVAAAPVTLSAHLHRFMVPLARAQSLQVGQVLPLTGCDVHSVRLLDPAGKKVAQAKLGQLGGMRAVRIEQAPPRQMGDLTPPGITAADPGDTLASAGMDRGDDPDLAPGANDPQPVPDDPSETGIDALSVTD